MLVSHSANNGILTISKAPRLTAGLIESGSSRVFPKLYYTSQYHYIRASEDLEEGNIVFINQDNSASKTRDNDNNYMGFVIKHIPLGHYGFVGISGAFVVDVENAAKSKIVYFNEQTNALTSLPMASQIQGSSFLSDKDVESNKAIILIRE